MFWFKTADIVFTIFHIVLTLFNLTGWAFNRLRRIHLVSILLTLGSWLVLGFFYGFGYCFLTDWHWDVKQELGEKGLPNSFIKYYLDILFNADIPANTVDIIAIAGLVFALAMTIIRNRDLLSRR